MCEGTWKETKAQWARLKRAIHGLRINLLKSWLVDALDPANPDDWSTIDAMQPIIQQRYCGTPLDQPSEEVPGNNEDLAQFEFPTAEETKNDMTATPPGGTERTDPTPLEYRNACLYTFSRLNPAKKKEIIDALVEAKASIEKARQEGVYSSWVGIVDFYDRTTNSAELTFQCDKELCLTYYFKSKGYRVTQKCEAPYPTDIFVHWD